MSSHPTSRPLAKSTSVHTSISNTSTTNVHLSTLLTFLLDPSPSPSPDRDRHDRTRHTDLGPYHSDLRLDGSCFRRGVQESLKSAEVVIWICVGEVEGTTRRTEIFKTSPFPPLTPTATKEYRNVCCRWLENLKRDGKLRGGAGGGGVVVRRSMLDECKGDKFENLITSLLLHALETRLSQNPRGGGGVGSSSSILKERNLPTTGKEIHSLDVSQLEDLVPRFSESLMGKISQTNSSFRRSAEESVEARDRLVKAKSLKAMILSNRKKGPGSGSSSSSTSSALDTTLKDFDIPHLKALRDSKMESLRSGDPRRDDGDEMGEGRSEVWDLWDMILGSDDHGTRTDPSTGFNDPVSSNGSGNLSPTETSRSPTTTTKLVLSNGLGRGQSAVTSSPSRASKQVLDLKVCLDRFRMVRDNLRRFASEGEEGGDVGTDEKVEGIDDGTDRAGTKSEEEVSCAGGLERRGEGEGDGDGEGLISGVGTGAGVGRLDRMLEVARRRSERVWKDRGKSLGFGDRRGGIARAGSSSRDGNAGVAGSGDGLFGLVWEREEGYKQQGDSNIRAILGLGDDQYSSETKELPEVIRRIKARIADSAPRRRFGETQEDEEEDEEQEEEVSRIPSQNKPSTRGTSAGSSPSTTNPSNPSLTLTSRLPTTPKSLSSPSSPRFASRIPSPKLQSPQIPTHGGLEMGRSTNFGHGGRGIRVGTALRTAARATNEVGSVTGTGFLRSSTNAGLDNRSTRNLGRHRATSLSAPISGGGGVSGLPRFVGAGGGVEGGGKARGRTVSGSVDLGKSLRGEEAGGAVGFDDVAQKIVQALSSPSPPGSPRDIQSSVTHKPRPSLPQPRNVNPLSPMNPSTSARTFARPKKLAMPSTPVGEKSVFIPAPDAAFGKDGGDDGQEGDSFDHGNESTFLIDKARNLGLGIVGEDSDLLEEEMPADFDDSVLF